MDWLAIVSDAWWSKLIIWHFKSFGANSNIKMRLISNNELLSFMLWTFSRYKNHKVKWKLRSKLKYYLEQRELFFEGKNVKDFAKISLNTSNCPQSFVNKKSKHLYSMRLFWTINKSWHANTFFDTHVSNLWSIV